MQGKYKMDPDEYIFGALSLYLDIVIMFRTLRLVFDLLLLYSCGLTPAALVSVNILNIVGIAS
jgi:hypothetical protein